MMKFQQLSAFKAVYELGTMTAAAELIHITQPAISRLIASLEQQLGFALFQRIKGRLLPTDQGRAFYVEVAKAFLAMDGLHDSAQDIRSQHYGSFDLCALPMLSNSFVPGILGQFLAQYDDLKASFSSYRSREVIRRTEIQSCDLGFALVDTQPAPSTSVIKQSVVGANVCIVPAASALAAKPFLVPQDLADIDFIRYESEDSTQRELDQLLRQQGISCHDILTVSFANVAAMLVAEGVGVAMVDPFTALAAKRNGLQIQIVPFAPHVRFQFHLLFPALRPVSPVTEAFVEYFFNQAKAAGIALQVGARQA